MENNGNLLTELYDIKRQNTDWEIKLENNDCSDRCDDTNGTRIAANQSQIAENKMQIIISSTDDNVRRNSINLNAFSNKNTSDNGVEIFIDNNPLKVRNFPLVASDGIKNVEQYVERRKINGITWYYCKWDKCEYGSNKSNHLVRHIRTHTGEKPYECDWPNCGKKFTDSWKRKDHQLSHRRKLLSSANGVVNSHLFSSLTNYSDNNSFKLFNGVYEKCDNNNDTSFDAFANNNNNIINFLPVHESNIKLEDDVEDESECDRDQRFNDDDSDMNMFIPEVIVSEIDEPSNNTPNQNSFDDNNTPNEMSITSVEQYVEKSMKNDRVLYSCKWQSCSYTTYKTYHMVRHIRTHTNEKPFACEFAGCGKSFADLYKKKDHQLTHNRKLITSVYNNDLVKIVIDMNQFMGKNNLFNGLDLVNNDGNEASFSNNDINSVQLPVTSSKLTFSEIDEQIANLNNCFVNQNVMSIKHVEPFVERRKIDNITWYFCKFPYCSYGSNKSNHLVRHVRTHTNTRPFVCPFPGCAKRFTDTWKLRDHQISHNKFNFTINRQKNEDLSISICNASDTYIVAGDELKNINGDECTDAKKLKSQDSTTNYLLTNSRFNTSNAGGDVVMSIKNVEEYVERRKVNGITYYYCKWPQCNYGSNKSNHLVRHVRTHTGERPFECDECFKRFTDSWKLKDHKLIHARKNAANNISSNSLNVVSNALVLSNNFGYDSNNDMNQFDDEVTIKQEKIEAIEYNKDDTDSKLDVFVPEVNVMEIKDLELTSRLNSSSSVSTNGDNSCYGILSIKNVEQYVEKSYRNDSNWYICKYSPDCNFGTAKCSYIVQHIYKHTGEKPYKCNWPQCSAKFNKKQNLTLHTMTHTGEKPLRCLYPNCYYSAVNSEALEVHYRRHTGEKPFSCDWINCDAKFAAKDELLKHTKTHVGDRFYYCHFPNCTYASKYRNKLTIHIRRHTNDRPFKCRMDNCEKAFIVSDKLKRHELSVHKVQF